MFSTARGAAPRRCISAPLRSSVRASANVPSGLRAPAITLPVSGSRMSPAALTATIAATTRPLGMRSAALPRPPFIERAGPAHLADRRAGAGADRAHRHRRRGRRFAPPCSRSRRRDGSCALLPIGRSNRIAAGTIGTLATPHVPADVVFLEPLRRAGCRVEAERAAARQDDRVDLVDHVERVEQIRLARPRRAAALRDAARHAFAVDQDHGAAGGAAGKREAADLESVDGGQRGVADRRLVRRLRAPACGCTRAPRGRRAASRASDRASAFHAPTIPHHLRSRTAGRSHAVAIL